MLSQYNSLTKQLQLGLLQLQLVLTEHQQQQLMLYLELLAKWNASYNLTAIREPETMLIQHVLDSLAIFPYIPAGNMIDVGTGGGLPGIVLAITFPKQNFVLLDSNGKKCRFLIHVKHALRLNNIEVMQSRVEEIPVKDNEQAPFNGVVSRAFASLRDMLQNTQHLCSNRGVFLAMKGCYPHAELAEIPPEFKVQKVVKLTIPFLTAERHLVIIGKQNG